MMPSTPRLVSQVSHYPKYVVNYHNGVSTHKDGSPFFDIAIFSNKRKKDRFVRELRRQGYRPRNGERP